MGRLDDDARLGIRFGEYVLDEASNALYRAGERCRIEPKPLELLFLLAQRRPDLVTFEEIHERLWGHDVVVTKDARNRAVSQARHAVGDDGSSQRVIATERGRGLRFVARAEVLRDPASAAAPPPPPIGDDGPFVGRDLALKELESQLGRAVRGRGGVALLAGEAGIGKTRLASELGEIARRRGASVHWGRTAPRDGDSGPYEPWRSLLRGLVDETAGAALSSEWAAAVGDLQDLLREPRGADAAEGTPTRVGPRVRARTVDAVGTVLTDAAQQRPRVLILDDLQWADGDSLSLLHTVMPEVAELPVLLVLIWRDAEARDGFDHVSRQARRLPHAEMALEGLEARDVARLLHEAIGEIAPASLVEAVHRKSDGNPFFVSEMLRLLLDRSRGSGRPLLAEPTDVEMPSSLDGVLVARLAPRTPRCLSLLEFASLLGRSVDLDVLRAASGSGDDDVEAGIEEALSAGLLRQDRQQAGRVEFSHWLLMHHLQQRARGNPEWHCAIADALEALHGARGESWGEIAYHRCLSLPVGRPQDAVAAARRAAIHASYLLAHQEAARYLDDAVRIQEEWDGADPRSRAEVLLDLGRAQLRAGARDEARRAFEAAAGLARRSAAYDLLARAALGFSGLPATVSGDHKSQRERVEEALGLLDEDNRALRARLLGRLASIRANRGDPAAAEGLAQQAVDLARSVGDPATVASTLRARNAVLVGDPLRTEERLACLEESLDFASRRGDELLAMDSRLHQAVALLHMGDADGFRRQMSAYRDVACRQRHPLMRYYGQLALATEAVLDGRFQEAEYLAGAALECGRRAEHPDAHLHHLFQVTQIRFLEGRLAEVAALLERVAPDAERTELLGLRAMLALVEAEAGDLREAASRTRHLIDAFGSAPRDSGWLSNLSLLALAVFRTRDVDSAERLTRLLEPLAHCTVSAFLVVCNGSASYYLGLLAHVRGRFAEARVHFDAARKANDALQALPWRIRSDLGLAASLGATGREGDRTRALEIARRVVPEAAGLGMPNIVAEAHALLARLTAGGTDVDPSEVPS